jgi:hypothetical protein
MLLARLTKHSHPTLFAERLCPSLIQQVQARPPLIEIKNSFNSKEKSFQLENWFHSTELCVGRWLPSSTSHSYQMPIGSYSWGVWRKDLNVGVYRIHDRYGNLIAYRVDILRDVEMRKKKAFSSSSLSSDSIQFFDLVVDLWLWPNDEGKVTEKEQVAVEDLDELSELKACGLVSDGDSQLIDETLCAVRSHPQRYVDLVDESIQRAVEESKTRGTSPVL